MEKRKGVIGVFICAVLVFFAVSCEIPQSVTVKGNPGLYLPLGHIKDVANITETISDEKIKEMLGDDQSMTVYSYEYAGTDQTKISDVRTYLVRYKIIDMPYDLSQYMQDADRVQIPLFNIPAEAASLPPGTSLPEDKSIYIPLGDDMTKLITNIKGNNSGIKIPYKEEYKDYLKVYIEDLKVGTSASYKQGEKEEIGGKEYLVFKGNNFDFSPREKSPLEVKIKIEGPCSGTIKPEMIFDWTEATVKTSDKPLNGEFDIDLGDLTGFLGEGVTFKKVNGYLYIHNLPSPDTTGDKNTMSLDFGSANFVPAGTEIKNKDTITFVDDKPVTVEIPAHSIEDIPSIDFTTAFNTAGKTTLEYKIIIPSSKMEKANAMDQRIRADLVIELPLKFKVEATSGLWEDGNEKFIKLKLAALPEFESDLLGRSGPNDDLFKDINNVEIAFKDSKNNVFGTGSGTEFKKGITIGILYNEQNEPKQKTINIVEGGENPKPLKFAGLDYPFRPQFSVLVPVDDAPGSTTGTLNLLRTDKKLANGKYEKVNPVFDFMLTVAANIKLDLEF